MNLNTNQKTILKRLGQALCFFCAIVVLTRIALQLSTVANPTTVGFSFLVIVVLSAVFAGIAVAVVTSFTATLFFNYFFFPPIGTFRIAKFEDWVALFAFLFTAIVISRLTASARENARKSAVLDRTVAGLKEFSAWILSTPHDLLTLSGIAEAAVHILSLQYCSIHVYAEGKWHHFSGISVGKLSQQVADSLKITSDHPTDIMELIEEQGLGVRYSQIRTGTESVAVVAVKSEYLPDRAIDIIASMTGVLLRETLMGTDVSREKHTR